MGRSRNTALVLISQNAGDLLNEQVTNCLSSVSWQKGRYAFSVYGPDGFLHSFAGSVIAATPELQASGAGGRHASAGYRDGAAADAGQ